MELEGGHEETIAANVTGSAADAEFDTIVGELQDIVMGEPGSPPPRCAPPNPRLGLGVDPPLAH